MSHRRTAGSRSGPDVTTTAVAWRNRIVGHGDEPPEQLLANPANWRTHPKEQQQALAGALSEVSWVGRSSSIGQRATSSMATSGSSWRSAAVNRQSRSCTSSSRRPRNSSSWQRSIRSRPWRTRRRTRSRHSWPRSRRAMLPWLGSWPSLADQHGIRRPVLGDPDEVPPLPDARDLYVKAGAAGEGGTVARAYPAPSFLPGPSRSRGQVIQRSLPWPLARYIA